MKDPVTKQPKMNCRNWECGVVIPVTVDAAKKVVSEKSANSQKVGVPSGEVNVPGMDVFDGSVPVPMVVPGEHYGARRPWFYKEQ